MQMHSLNDLLYLNIAFTLYIYIYICFSKTFRPNVCFTACNNCLLIAVAQLFY
ncbi:hypothetical protein XELAEV_18030055mg [Xenopus laevis]|uniref:Uncharacterized protein n=1 Tax=Xenopus laevis TaxID=8355 RepID=A0A974HID1_XENLA|nr:hypothetical protein XELAEV_18030055mg [Xenopus laevis]